MDRRQFVLSERWQARDVRCACSSPFTFQATQPRSLLGPDWCKCLITSGDQGILMPAPTFYMSRRVGWAAKSGAREEPHHAGTTTIDVNKTSKGTLVSCSLLFYYLHIVCALFSCKQGKPNWLLPSSRSGVTASDTSQHSNLYNPIPHSSSACISPLSLAIS